jgi:hypothetical protein
MNPQIPFIAASSDLDRPAVRVVPFMGGLRALVLCAGVTGENPVGRPFNSRKPTRCTPPAGRPKVVTGNTGTNGEQNRRWTYVQR